MDYLDLYNYLKTALGPGTGPVPVGDGLRVTFLPFASENGRILPGESRYACATHGGLAWGPGPGAVGHPAPGGGLDLQDSHVAENQAFQYQVFHRADGGPARELLLLFHGLNEKDWAKYLPWAHHLARVTGKAVLLFPVAFHMNRAPAPWSEHRAMHRVSQERKGAFPEVIASSLSNVAISTRLQTRPERFIWSGLQTYCDVVQLLRAIRAGRHPLVAPDASVDILAYSIGCLLSQVFLMADPDGLFADTRLALFCGGAVFNRMSPVTKFILDSEANVALYSYMVEHLESHLRQDARLCHYLGPDHPEGMHFRSMLSYGVLRPEREAQFRRLAPRLLAIPLVQDLVIPPYEVVNTLQGPRRDIPVPVAPMDFPYPYQHENPFPVQEARRGEVDEGFRAVFDRIAEFIRRS
jgi:hypothetical protein